MSGCLDQSTIIVFATLTVLLLIALSAGAGVMILMILCWDDGMGQQPESGDVADS